MGACDRGGGLETRTFKLNALGPRTVAKLIEPYVYSDRKGSAGTLSVSDLGITVRERPENLKRIEEVLKKYDQVTGITLRFTIVEAADSAGGAVDPEILRALKAALRYPSYREVASSIVQGTVGGSVSQVVGSGDRRFVIAADLSDARRPSPQERGSVRLFVRMVVNDSQVLEGAMVIPDSQTVVVGSAQPLGSDRAIFLVVRPTINPPAQSPS
jgi:hypothetical protein